jgi:cell division transport system permease protein
MIAGRFAGRITLLAFTGGILGVVLVVPLLLGLASLTAPFQPPATAPSGLHGKLPAALLAALPGPLWAVMPALPPIAAAIGWVTTQATVRRWLARLP